MKKSVFSKLCLLLALLMAMQVFAVSCDSPDQGGNDDTTAGDTGNAGENTTTAPEETTEAPETEAPPVELTLVQNGEFQYCVVVPDNASEEIVGAASYIQTTVFSMTKKLYDIVQYSQIGSAYTDRYIYIGFYPEDLEGVVFPRQMNFGTWVSNVIDGKHISISSYSADALNVGISDFTKVLKAAYSDGNATLSYKATVGGAYGALFSYAPVPATYGRDTVFKTFEVGENVPQLRIDGMSALDAVQYLDGMEACGLVKHSESNIGNVMSGTYYVENKVVYYITYHTGALRINGMTYRNAFLPENVDAPNYEEVCDTKGYMIGVTGDETNTQNGMCFVYLLGDGTFMVFDGGRNTSDSGHLYNWLKKIADENDIDEIVISAMHITHAHGDHYGFFDHFMSYYVAQGMVKVEAVWLNQSTPDQGGNEATSNGMIAGEKKIVQSVKSYSPDTEIIHLHTGQSFYMADVKVDIMQTMEDFDQYYCYRDNDSNAASTTMRLTIDGMTVLMTGDAYRDCTNMMAAMYEEELYVDFLQVPHHGVWKADNGTIAFYDAIQPKYALFPCGEKLYNDYSKKQSATMHLLNNVMEDRNTIGKNVFVAGHYAKDKSERVTEIDFENEKITVLVNKGQ